MIESNEYDWYNQPKIYRMYGIDTAMQMLRPGARWEISNRKITLWDDPRPKPTWEEIVETLEKIKAFEDSVKTIYTKEQIEKIQPLELV